MFVYYLQFVFQLKSTAYYSLNDIFILEQIGQFYRGPPIHASCQISVHLAKRFQRKQLFLFKPIRNKNCT